MMNTIPKKRPMDNAFLYRFSVKDPIMEMMINNKAVQTAAKPAALPAPPADCDMAAAEMHATTKAIKTNNKLAIHAKVMALRGFVIQQHRYFFNNSVMLRILAYMLSSRRLVPCANSKQENPNEYGLETKTGRSSAAWL